MKIGYILNERYQINALIGEGGMANVYRARDLILNRDVSVKLLRLDLRDNPDAMRRFQREAYALTELTNPHIVTIYDYGEEGGMQYLVTEYVAGTDLRTYINQHFPFRYTEVIRIMDQILDAMAAAHAHNIIHRDLKPQNILIDNQGNVKVTDFGIALADTMTRTNAMVGSVHYISPEQARGGAVTAQSDIYSLGIILFVLLTNTLPYNGDTPVAIALKHSKEAMPSVRKYDVGIPQSLENVVLHATAKKRPDRYPTVVAMKKDLDSALSFERQGEVRWEPRSYVNEETKVLPTLNTAAPAPAVEAQPNTPTERPVSSKKDKVPVSHKANHRRHHPRRWRWAIAGVGVILLGILGGGAVWALVPQQVPAVAGMTVATARTALQEKHLRVAGVTKQYNSHYLAGQVITTTPGQGKKVRRNGAVRLVVSQGADRKRFGDYQGQSFNQVKRRLEHQGMTVLRQNVYVPGMTAGQIMDQSIAPGERVVPQQTTVTLTVNTGQQLFHVKNVTGWSLKHLKRYATEESLRLVIINKSTSDYPNNTVISQQPAPRVYVRHGAVLRVVVAVKPGSMTQTTTEVPVSNPGTLRRN
ncbi:Stk1 family PASTA domain-containing Ser/Thr kinase [Ligilactobacillus sp. LYQ139]|uniref:Stk1 family PASTA domain-containing Ser/Thr kinase n=1 Tax=Ligilactobacillus sp. LYQ139 TaxID=3378800 RepID=UPI0038520106